MGGIVSSIFGGGGGGGGRAAQAANVSNQAAVRELRRQFNITQEQLTPFIEAGAGALPGVIEGTTVEGLDARLAEIFDTDIFSSLVGERTRAAQGQLAAAGLTRSGTAVEQQANIPTQIGLGLESLLSGRQTALAGTGLGAASGLGAFGAQSSGGIANLVAQQGQNVSSGILADQQARAQGGSNLLSVAATAAGIFFSDPALKKNAEVISKIGDLPLWQWDWIPQAKGTMIEKCGTMGFMADEVQEKYPDHVHEFCGFLVIDYPSLLDDLEGQKWLH